MVRSFVRSAETIEIGVCVCIYIARELLPPEETSEWTMDSTFGCVCVCASWSIQRSRELSGVVRSMTIMTDGQTNRDPLDLIQDFDRVKPVSLHERSMRFIDCDL